MPQHFSSKSNFFKGNLAFSIFSWKKFHSFIHLSHCIFQYSYALSYLFFFIYIYFFFFSIIFEIKRANNFLTILH
jgi:hypothetical protein